MSEVVTIGNATLYRGDCLAAMREMPDNAFELAIVDPPYGININSSGRLGHYGGKGKDWDSYLPTDEYFIELNRVSKNQIVWGANYFRMNPTRCFLIWDKMQPKGVSFADSEFGMDFIRRKREDVQNAPTECRQRRTHTPNAEASPALQVDIEHLRKRRRPHPRHPPRQRQQRYRLPRHGLFNHCLRN